MNTIRAAAGILAAGLWAAEALAATFPQSPVHLVVPYSAGGNTDIGARLVAQGMSEQLDQPVVVENRPGANTAVGSAMVAKSRPDGYTLLFTTISLAVNPHLYPDLSYDTKRDFTPVAWATISPLLLVTNPALPADTLAEFIDYLKTHPGTPYGSSGSGGSMHLATELFRYQTKTDALHVPYKGEGPVLVDLIGGRVKFAFASPSSATEHVKSGAIKALAIGGPERYTLLPDVPTAAEAGLPGFSGYTWCVVMAPAGTPADVVNRLNAAVNHALHDPKINDRLLQLGFNPVMDSTPATTARHIEDETAKWGALIRKTGMTAQ